MNTFDKVINFTQIMRQQGEENALFRDLLGKVSKGKLTEDDWKNHFCPRELKNLPEEEQKRFREMGTKLCTTNKALKKFNSQE